MTEPSVTPLGPSTFILLGISQEEYPWKFLLEPFAFPLFMIPESSAKLYASIEVIHLQKVHPSVLAPTSSLYSCIDSIESPTHQSLSFLVLYVHFVLNKIPNNQTFA